MRHVFILLLATVTSASAQLTRLNVVDEEGLPVIGATVELLDAETTLVTDLDGAVQWREGEGLGQRVRVRYVGYSPATINLMEASRDADGAYRIGVYPAQEVLAQAVVRAVRARPSDPFAFRNVDGERLSAANPGQDIPFLLRRTPGAVYTSDAGTGIGYTGIRIRGADATRVNVTVNGVPLNDSESQGVFWVNMPDFVSSTSSLQLQRGVGESTYGSGAFGANLNLVTNAPDNDPQVTAELGGGSFATARGMLRANTGDISGFSAETRLSYIRSEGFVDRAASRLGSAYLGTSYAISDQQRLQLIGWTGKERTYQSWFGIPEALAEDDARRTYNPAGERADGSYFDDQVDNYRQSHAQLLYTHAVNPTWLLQLTGHYTRGIGYFEEWRGEEALSRYFPGTGLDAMAGDLARRRWLDNHFFGGIATVSGALSPKLNTTLSAGYSRYLGDHYGTLSVIRAGGLNLATEDRYYDNYATKDDVNAFAKTNYQATRNGNLYVDLQLRHVRYDADFVPGDESARRRGQNTFFNPKIGWTQRMTSGFGASPQNPSSAYASFAVGQREPNRDDFENAAPGVTPRAEKLYNLELGLRSGNTGRFNYEVGGYYMLYEDQLAVTGALDQSGQQVRANVDDSYRVGVEVSAAYVLASHTAGGVTSTWGVDGNIAVSQNRIGRYDDAFEVYDDDFAFAYTEVIVRENVPLAFSPGVVANLGLTYGLTGSRGGSLDAALYGSLVGKQYLDNSGAELASLPAYMRADLELRYIPSAQGRVHFTLQLQNLTNSHPITNGYVYRYAAPGAFDDYGISEEGRRFVGKGVYPQAGFQVMAGLRLQLSGD